MNLQITNEIARRTNAAVTYTVDPKTHDTRYHVDKPPHVANVTVSAEFHAANDADAIADEVVRKASQLFTQARKPTAAEVKA